MKSEMSTSLTQGDSPGVADASVRMNASSSALSTARKTILALQKLGRNEDS
jgi:hypothetical protein